MEKRVYTRTEIAEELNISPTRLDNIKRKLDKLGYKYECSGRGDNFLLEIKDIPAKMDLIKFADTYMGIKTNRAEDLAHFLKYLINDNDAPCYPTRIISQFTHYSRTAIDKYMVLLRNCNFLIYIGSPYYYATYVVSSTPDVATNTYKKYRKIRPISYDMWKLSYTAFYNAYEQQTKDILDNPEMCEELAADIANKQKCGVLDGWWPCRECSTVQVINKNWPQYEELLSLLDEYTFEEYINYEVVDIDKEFQEKIKRLEEIEEKLYYKGKIIEEEKVVKKITQKHFNSPDDMMDFIVENNLFNEIKRVCQEYDEKFRKRMDAIWAIRLGYGVGILKESEVY